MKRFASVAAVALLLPSHTPAQTHPDLAGRWLISQVKSSPGAVGNNAKVPFPSELIVMQHPSELHVEMRFARAADSVTAAYRLDGSEITVGTPAGITEKATAKLDGGKLVITARRVIASAFGDFVTDTTEVWSVAGIVLTIVKTQTGDGVSDTETAVYEKDPAGGR